MSDEEPTEALEVDPKRASQLASARRTALAIAESALERKAGNVEIIDVCGKVDYADFVVVMSGRSDRQVAAIAKNVEKDVHAKTDARCLSIEGLPLASWILMDFGDVIAHVFRTCAISARPHVHAARQL